MSENKNAILFFNNLEDFHLHKDVGMFPVYLNKLGYNFKIVCYRSSKNDNIPSSFRGVEIIKLKPITLFNKIPLIKRINFTHIIYILKNYKNIDLLFFFHLTLKKLSTVKLFKFMRPKSKVYLKLDMDLRELVNFKKYMKSDKSRKKRIIKLLSYCDLITSEIEEVMQEINSEIKKYIPNRVKYMSNGIDISSLNKYEVKPYQNKKKQIITVCRIGTKQKNNEMFLSALKNLDLKDWEVLFIGPIEDSFTPIIKDFFDSNPDKKESVKFLGSVYDKDMLFKYYMDSRVFFLTSLYETFPLASLEGMYFGNYLIQTPTGNENKVAPSIEYGTIIKIGDVEMLRETLMKIVNGDIKMKTSYEISDRTIKNFSYEVLAKKVIELLEHS